MISGAKSYSDCAELTLDLGNAVRVTKDLTNLGGVAPFFASLRIWSTTCSGWSSTTPGVARVGDGRGRYSLSVAVKTTHFRGFVRGAGVSTGVAMRAKWRCDEAVGG